MSESLSHVRSAAKSFHWIACLSCSSYCCSCCFESCVDFWGLEAADQSSEHFELQVSNPSGAQLWVLSGRPTVETCASNNELDPTVLHCELALIKSCRSCRLQSRDLMSVHFDFRMIHVRCFDQ